MASIVGMILVGEADDELDRIGEAVRTRRKQLELVRAASLRVGDRVKIGGHIRPQYLRGVTGEVVSFGGDKISVRVDEAYRYNLGRFMRPDATIRFPAATVEPL